MSLPFFIDFHCHPAMKPYGWSYSGIKPGTQAAKPDNLGSLWYYDPPGFGERLLQNLAGITKWRQSDARSLLKGNCRLVFASLYPIERGFFRNKTGKGILSDLSNDFVTSLGIDRINYIQNNANYYEDLTREYRFYEQLNGKTVKIGGQEFSYRMLRSLADLQTFQNDPANKNIAPNTVFFAMSIEGLHALNTNMEGAPDEAGFLRNLQAVRKWAFPPLFATVAHHFWNGLCGHAHSLFDIVGKNTDQSEGMNTGFTALGKKIIAAMLDPAAGRPIYPDVKHMSMKSRQEYYAMLETGPFAGRPVPIIVSHGAANGRRSAGEPIVDIRETGDKFMAEDINFYDEEIIRVARSGGIFGLQLDERRLAHKGYKIKGALGLDEKRHRRAELAWNHIQHIAELLDRAGLPAWDTTALGTDHDGIINPINGFLSAEDLDDLQQYLGRYAFNYMAQDGKKRLKPQNQLPAATIMEKVFSGNGSRFLERWFV